MKDIMFRILIALALLLTVVVSSFLIALIGGYLFQLWEYSSTLPKHYSFPIQMGILTFPIAIVIPFLNMD